MIRPLGIVWNFDPVFFEIGSLDIRYYGLMWVLAIFVGAGFVIGVGGSLAAIRKFLQV